MSEERDELVELRRSRSYLQAIVANAPVVLWALDANGVFELSEGKGLAALGLAPGEVVGRSVFELYADEPEVLEHVRRALRGESFTATNTLGELTFESRYEPLLDPGGAVRGVVGVSTDVSAQWRATRQQRRLAAAVETAADGIAILDRNERYVYLNDAHARIYGYDGPEQLIGHGWRELYGEQQLREFEEHHMPELRREGLWRGQSIGKRRDGSSFPQEVSLKALDDGGLVCICRDITERQTLEAGIRNAQRLESLGVLAGGVAHDFNNLLAAIRGRADLAVQALAEVPEARVHLEAIGRAAARAAELCRQLLAYAGRGRLRVRRCDLSSIVGEMAELLEVSMSKKVELSYALARDLPPVLADPSSLEQIVLNLIVNASEALESTGGTVIFSTGACHCSDRELRSPYLEQDLPPGEYVYFEVKDDGPGMDPATLQRVFDPFFTTKFTGRGLGLAAVLGIVRAHRGTIRIDSSPGRGTAVRVLLPAATGEATVDAPAVEPGPFSWRGRGRVLVVDDEEAVRSVVREILERAGLEVEVAEDGRRAVEEFGNDPERFDLVVLDFLMPRLDGVETLRELRRLRPSVRVVLMSGYDDGSAGRQLGVDAFVQKPFEMGELLRAVQLALT